MTGNRDTEDHSDSTSINITVGTEVYDRENDQSHSLVVVDCPAETCSEREIPAAGQTVAELNESYPADADVCVAVFVSDLEREIPGWERLDPSGLLNTVHEVGVKTYSYPKPRLATYTEQDASKVPQSITTYRELICYQYARLIHLAADVDNYAFLWDKYEKLIENDIEMVSITKENKYQLQESFGVCTYCGSESETTYDHIIPISEGGSTDISNQVPACQSCNSAKGDQDVIDWHQKRNEPVSRIVWGKYLKLYQDQLDEANRLDDPIPDAERERWNGIEITRNITRRIRSSHIKRDESGRKSEQTKSQNESGQSKLDQWEE